MSTYEEFLASKIKLAPKGGIQVNRELLHHSLRPDQKDIALWGLELGAALIAPDAGMGKTRIGIEVCRILVGEFGGKALIVTELGAADTFIDKDPEVGEAAAMGLTIDYVTCQEESLASACSTVVTNYERVRDGRFDFSGFTVVWLDEGDYVKNMASETTNVLKFELAKVKYKYIATATPSPNEVLELINYAHVLGICDRGQILTRFFQRNSVKAGELTLHPQHEDDFWLWVHSWCIAITSPKDLGYDYPGFELPELRLHWVEVPIGKALDAGNEKDGQARLFIQSRSGLAETAKIKRESIDARIYKALEIRSQFPQDHFILWHHLEAERKAIKDAFDFKNKSFGEIYGSQDWEIREKNIIGFTKGELTDLSTKPSVSGVGCNFQKYCCKEIFVGITDSFTDLYQALKRVYRFYNPSKTVDIWLLYTPEEYDIVLNLQRKWQEHDTMREKTRLIIEKYGLNHSKYIEEKRRSFKMDRKEWKGDSFDLANNDSVLEIQHVPDNSAGMILTSIPFGNHYEYSDKYNDFGHNQTNEDFFKQMNFLVPQMLRVLQPGRIAAIHTKNRIHYGSVTGRGFSTFHRFTHMAADCFEKHGFHTMGFHYVPTDVVAENNQTYRLGYGEMQKDSTKMGSGIPEEIWIFRKAPTSNAKAYADIHVEHNMGACPFCNHIAPVGKFIREGAIVFDCPSCKQFFPEEELATNQDEEQPYYSIANWQIDADAFWRSSGDRYLQPEELAGMNMKQVRAWWNKFNAGMIYDYDQHVELLKLLDSRGKLSRKYTTLPLRSNVPYIWNDVNRMQGLNLEQSKRKQQNHICPMPYDQVGRLIELYSNPGDRVDDDFGGLGTTGVESIKRGRRTRLCELNETYAKCAYFYLRQAEQKKKIPTLFDMIQPEPTL
jgi:DNA modification methylase